MIDLRHIDCMEYLATCEDNAFELAIVDPPYGIGMDGRKGSKAKKACHNWQPREFKNWDKAIPSKKYFKEIQRVSLYAIIWGGNYFSHLLPSSRCWLFWDKGQDLSMPDGELAWTNMDRPIRRKTINRASTRVDGIIHPTQKPVKLYEWLLMNYAKKGDRIIDTHLGSGSIAIACHNLGFDLVGCELDQDYYNAACKRLEQHQAQQRMF